MINVQGSDNLHWASQAGQLASHVGVVQIASRAAVHQDTENRKHLLVIMVSYPYAMVYSTVFCVAWDALEPRYAAYSLGPMRKIQATHVRIARTVKTPYSEVTTPTNLKFATVATMCCCLTHTCSGRLSGARVFLLGA